MLLSDLIRRGAEQTDPISGALTQSYPDGSIGACALGAAAYVLLKESLLAKPHHIRALSTAKQWVPPARQPEGFTQWVEAARRMQLGRVIMILNDQRGWSREAIAEWLDAEFSDEELRVPSEELCPARKQGCTEKERDEAPAVA